MRYLILGVGGILAVIALLAMTMPDQFAVLGQDGIARIAYALTALLLVGSGLVAARRIQPAGRGPGVVTSALIWIALIVVLVVLYRAAWIWAGILQVAAMFVS